jgi:hypothetical protein
LNAWFVDRRPVNSTVMPQPQTNIEEFVARHSQSDFRHKDQLFSLLASGAATCETNASLVTCEQLLNIYRRRADHLRTYDTPHARQLREDVLALCDALAAATDNHCRLWNFSSPPNCDYAIFEGAETGRILGCVFAKDKRLTPPDEWDNLWRETKAANHDAA